MRKSGNKTVIAELQNDFSSEELSRAEVDQLFSATYEELRRLAAFVKGRTKTTSLTPTVLVHEAWIKLAGSPGFGAVSVLHFKRIAARAMRQLLVESARRRLAQKRGGDEQTIVVVFDDALGGPAVAEDEVLRLNDALDELKRLNPRQSLLVESRFFGGLEVVEAAELLNVSEATVLRDWRAAKAWLARELRRGAASGG